MGPRQNQLSHKVEKHLLVLTEEAQGWRNLKGPQGSGGLPLVPNRWISSIPISCDLETGPCGVRVTTGTSIRSLFQCPDRNTWTGGVCGQGVGGWL